VADRFLQAAESSAAAARILEEAANCYGVAAANLANLFNPELIVIGGWLGLKLGPTLLDRIREVVREQALDYTANCVRIELDGSARMPWRSRVRPGRRRAALQWCIR